MTTNENIFTKFLPKQEYLHPAWYGCLHWAIGSEEILEQFKNDTGIEWKFSKNILDIMVDKACGADKEFFKIFAAWMNENIWGTVDE